MSPPLFIDNYVVDSKRGRYENTSMLAVCQCYGYHDLMTLEDLEYITFEVGRADGSKVTVMVDGDYDGEYLSTHFYWTYNAVTGVIGGYELNDNRHGGRGKARGTYVQLHRLVSGAKGRRQWVRHKDGNKFNNRSCNLEILTPKEAMVYRKSYRRGNAPYGYTGISRYIRKSDGQVRWTAQVAGRHWGSYNTAEEAARRYDEVALKLFGDKAQLNFTPRKS